MTAESMLRLRVLGGLSLTREGERLSDVLTGSKRTALLVYLAVCPVVSLGIIHDRSAP